MRKESLKRDNYDGSQDSDSDSDFLDANKDKNTNATSNGEDLFDALIGNSNLTTTTSIVENKDSTDNVAWLGGEATSRTNGVSTEQNDEKEKNADNNDDTDDGNNDDTNDKPTETTNNDAEEETSSEKDGNYEVEEIIDHKYIGKRKKQYLIRWKGYTADDDTWEPEDSLECAEMIEKYLEIHPDTRPPKKDPKPDKPKKERPPGLPARDTPKRERIKYPQLDFTNGDDTQKSKKRDKKKKSKKPKGPAEYEVERIIDDRTDRGITVYRIRWKGYNADQDTWEPAASLTCDNLVEKYWAKKSKVEYEVERICGHKIEGNQSFYLVKWKGYNASENTWEPEKTVNCPELINEYVKKNFNIRTEIKQPAKPLVTKAAKKSIDFVAKRSSKSTKSPQSPAKKRKIVASESESEAESELNVDSDDENRDPLAIDDKEWEVQEVIDERYMKGKKEYLIRWKGCNSDDDTWEPADQVSCSDLIAKFERKQRMEKKTGTPNKAGKRVSITMPTTRKSSRRST